LALVKKNQYENVVDDECIHQKKIQFGMYKKILILYSMCHEKLIKMRDLMLKWIGRIILSAMQLSHLVSAENYENEISFFQKLPKAELHLHLGGAYPKSYLFSIASSEQSQELEDELNSIANRVNYHDVFRVFSLVSQIVNSELKVQKGVEALCLSLKEDQVEYVEIRTGLKDLGKGREAYLTAILDGIQTQISDQFRAKLILSLQRNSSLEIARETVDLALKYQNSGVIGIDISGDSTIGQIDDILPELFRAKERGLFFVVHLGESPDEKDQMQLLSMLDPIRVGHGVHLFPEAAHWILTHKIPLEICLTSSVLVKMIDRYDQHPGIQFFNKGHPIVFCTDDPLIFSTSLSKELMLAHLFAGFSIDDLKCITINAFNYSLESIRSNAEDI
jgi:adenosine deaminase